MEEKQSTISQVVGIGLIFLLLYLWMQYSGPTKKADDPNGQKTEQNGGGKPDSTAAQAQPAAAPATPAAPDTSARKAVLNARLGAFAPAGVGQEQIVVLENQMTRISFSSKGGRIKEVFLKNYQKINTNDKGDDEKSPVRLLEDEKDQFDLEIPVANTQEGKVHTSELYFTPTVSGKTVTFRADAGQGRYLEQRYTLAADNYDLDYQISGSGLQSVLSGQSIHMNWVNYLDKLEKNQQYERTMSSVYFKPAEASTDYCNCRKDVTESLGDKPVQWFAHSNQFFNTSLVAKDFAFRNFTGETHMYTDKDPDLKLLKTSADIPFDKQSVSMMVYSGPNEFDRLRKYGNSLQDIIPFGASIFGAINRWVIHFIFELLSKIIGSPGIVILMLTLIVKLLVYPLTYRMVYSQARMAALKPRIDELKKKHGDDQQAMSMETMKMYSEFKVNPLGGCLPIFLQMPIWFALYRFFPAAIEFRQAGFLWATDLSSYDVALKLPMMLPGFGNHISAFTLIWVATTLWYTWYSMKQMDTTAMANPAMKYMQYLMPVMFMFFFNSFAAGLTLYLCFSNILNIGQTVATKRFLINHDKIREELEANRNKPKKTTGFRARLEDAMKEAQKQQDQQTKKKK